MSDRWVWRQVQGITEPRMGVHAYQDGNVAADYSAAKVDSCCRRIAQVGEEFEGVAEASAGSFFVGAPNSKEGGWNKVTLEVVAVELASERGTGG